MQAEDERTTILIVDDERGPRESLRMILAPEHRVRLAASGAEALEILRGGGVDLVTLDLRMPGIDGEDLMGTLRREFPAVEVIVITGCGSVESAAAGIRHGVCDYLQKPFDVVQVGASLTRGLARHRARVHLITFLEELGAVVGRDREARVILDEVRSSRELQERLGELLRAGDGRAGPLQADRTVAFLEVLAETVEIKDRYMRGHARRVAFYTGLLAQRLGLSNPENQQIRIASLLHDLGKVGVPTELLLRPGALDPRERLLVERHAEIGARLLAPLPIPAGIGAAIRHHHEWWDGTGYPDGIAGEEIPFAARIIGIADAFDAMSCSRPYRRPLAREVVISELRRYAGIQFDPDLAKEFLAMIGSGAFDVDLDFIVGALTDTQPAPELGAAAR